MKKRLVTMVDSKNLVMEGSYHSAPISVDEMWAWLEKYAAIFKDYICDVGQYLADADAAGKKVLFEAQLALCATSTSASTPTPPPPTSSALTPHRRRHPGP